MENKTEKKSFRALAIILSIIGVLMICTVVFSLSYPRISSNTSSTEWHNPKKVTKVFTQADDFITHIENVIGFDFPDNYKTNYNANHDDSFTIRANENEDTIDYFCCLFLDDDVSQEDMQKLDQQVAQDERFIESLGDLKILVDSVGGDNLYEYKMVYVMDNDECNTMPDTAGEYRIITVFYDTDDHSFTIKEFNNKYWKLERNAQ